MKTRAYKQVDVFTDQRYFGNPLAVVLDGSDLDDHAMQRFACWTNLSETTFLLPPTEPSADYRVRIFTPGGELPFAGHPTLGSCHAWLQAGGQPKQPGRVVQQCQQGLVEIRLAGSRPAFAAPPMKRSAPDPAQLARIAGALGLEPTHIVAAQQLDNGPVWLTLLLDKPDTVLQLTPDHAALKQIGVKVGVAALYPAVAAVADTANTTLIARGNREARAFAPRAIAPGPGSFTPDLEVRGFAASAGIDEDPVTGSLNASLAQWLIEDGHAPKRYQASQGVCLGRAGQVYIERDAHGQVWVGGDSVTCIAGSVEL